MKKGDIILIPFPFTDLTGSKNRPAIVLCSSKYDITLAFVSSQVKWKDQYDVLLKPSVKNGLKTTSLVKLNKIATIDKDLALGRMGRLSAFELEDVDATLKLIFKLP